MKKIIPLAIIPLILSIGIIPALPFADSYQPKADSYQSGGARVTVLINVAGDLENTDPVKRAKEIRNLQSSVLKFLSITNGINILSNPQKNEITGQIHPHLIEILEDRSDVLSVTILDQYKLSKDGVIPPLKQKLAGLSANQVICKEGLNLVFKATDGSPICVKASTVYKLIERSWISIESAFAQEAEPEIETEQVLLEPKTITTQQDFLPNESDRAMYFEARFSAGLIKYTEIVKSNFFKFTPFKRQIELNPIINPENPLPNKPPLRFLLETLPSKENINYYNAIDDYFQTASTLFKEFDVSIDVVTGDGTVLQTWEYRNCDLEDYTVYLQDNIIFNRFHGGDGPEIRERSIFHCSGLSLVAPEN